MSKSAPPFKVGRRRHRVFNMDFTLWRTQQDGWPAEVDIAELRVQRQRHGPVVQQELRFEPGSIEQFGFVQHDLTDEEP